MTTEIAVMNKGAIALAADSAVTIGAGNMFYNTANKLFALSKYNPVGIMVYSNAEFMGYPIDVIIKEYRKKLGNNTYDTLKEYWDNFLEYLTVNLDDSNSYSSYYLNIKSVLNDLDLLIKEDADNLIDDNGEMSKEEIQKRIYEVLADRINGMHQYFLSLPDDENFSEIHNEIREKTEDNIKELIEYEIGLLSDSLNEKVIEICIMILTKKT